MKILDDNEIEELNSVLYKKISELYKKESNKNLWTDLLKMNISKRKEFFKKIIIHPDELNLLRDKLEYLKNEDILYLADEIDTNYIITLKGIIISDYNIGEIPNVFDKFLNDLNREYFLNLFDKKSREPLELKEKAIIIFLLGLMAFTENYSLKSSKFIDQDSEILKTFRNSIDQIANFIVELKGYEDDEKYVKTLFKSESEGNVVHTFLRRLDNIQVRTYGIYKKERDKHYLDILDQNSINEKKLNYILNKVFDKRKLTSDERIHLIDLLEKIEGERIYLIDNDPDFNFFDIKDNLHHKIKLY